jgi:hypothetical protein
VVNKEPAKEEVTSDSLNNQNMGIEQFMTLMNSLESDKIKEILDGMSINISFNKK